MPNTLGRIFGGIIAFILLSLYAVAIAHMTLTVHHSGSVDPAKEVGFPEGIVLIVTVVGGLISALVVAKVAITEPNTQRTVLTFTSDPQGNQGWIGFGLTVVYLAVWILAGVAALLVGTVLYPNVNATLKDVGTVWLGLAVSAGYAYWGITPKKP